MHFLSKNIAKRGISNAQMGDRHDNRVGHSDIDFLHRGIPFGGLTVMRIAIAILDFQTLQPYEIG